MNGPIARVVTRNSTHSGLLWKISIRWGGGRDEYENGLRVDSDGVLFRRHGFGGVVEFKDAILKEKERFVRALAGHLLTFALGRELTPADSPALDEVAQLVSTQEYRMKALIKAVAFRTLFRQGVQTCLASKAIQSLVWQGR